MLELENSHEDTKPQRKMNKNEIGKIIVDKISGTGKTQPTGCQIGGSSRR